MALLERTFPGAAGLRIDQRHVNAHIVHDGVWLDVHLSKPRYTPAGRRAVRCDHPHGSLRQQGDRGRGLRRGRAPPRADDGLGLSRARRRLFQSIGEYDKAIADFTQVVRLEPDFAGSVQGPRPRLSPQGRARSGDRRLRSDHPAGAERDLGYFGRGSIHQERGELDRAIADFDDVIRLDPKHAFAFEQRGRAYEHKGDRDKAIADYRMVLALVTTGPVHQRAKKALGALGA